MRALSTGARTLRRPREADDPSDERVVARARARADVAEPIGVLVALHLADELLAAGARRSPPGPGGAWNFTSSSRPWPSGASIIASSARTPSSPRI